MGRAKDGENARIVQALKPVYCRVAALSGEAKDPKQGWLLQEGPHKRPLCNGNVGANATMGYVSSILMRPLRADANRAQATSICSREELLHAITDVNNRIEEIVAAHEPARPTRACKRNNIQDFSKLVVGSMDVCSLYPNCRLKECCSYIKDTVKLGLTTYEGLYRR